MAESVTITVTDPATGKPSKWTRKQAPTEAELAKIKQHYGEVTVAPVTQTEKIIGVKRTQPDAKKALVDLGQVAAYAALGLIPGGAEAAGAARIGAPTIAKFLASHPEAASAITRIIASAGIGGTGAAVEGKNIGKAAKDSGLTQALFEAVVPPAFNVGARLSGRGWRNQSDAIAKNLMADIKKEFPSLKSLPDSHEGVQALTVRGDAQALLSKDYGQALQAVKGAVPEGETMLLSLEDARALKIPEASISPIQPPVGQGMNFTEARVPTRLVIDKVHGVGKKDMGLSQRVMDKLDASLGSIEASLPGEFREARRVYMEGKSLINGLKEMNVYDEGAKRLNVERLSKGSDVLDTEGKSVWEKFIKGPKARDIIKRAIPSGPSPHAVGIPFVKATPTHVYGGFHGSEGPVSKVLENTQPPSIFYSGNIPLTEREATIKRYAPGAVHAITKETGVTP